MRDQQAINAKTIPVYIGNIIENHKWRILQVPRVYEYFFKSRLLDRKAFTCLLMTTIFANEITKYYE